MSGQIGRSEWTRRAPTAAFLLLLSVLMTTGVASKASAQVAAPVTPTTRPRGPRLSFSAPAGCGDEATFRSQVAIMFQGQDPFDPDALDVVSVTFTKIPGGYRGTVQYTPANGEPWPAQETAGALCSFIFPTVAVVASLRVPDRAPEDAGARSRDGAAPSGGDAAPEPADPVRSKQRDVFAPPPIPSPRFTRSPSNPPLLRRLVDMDLTIALHAAAFLTVGLTADVGPAFQIGVDVRGEMLSLGLELRGALPGKVFARDAIDPAKPTVPQQLDVGQMSVQLVPCLRFAKYFSGCVVGQASWLFTQSAVDSGFLSSLGIGPRLGAELPLGDRFALFASGEAIVYPSPAGVLYNQPDEKGQMGNEEWIQSPVTGFFGGGVLVKFQ